MASHTVSILTRAAFAVLSSLGLPALLLAQGAPQSPGPASPGPGPQYTVLATIPVGSYPVRAAMTPNGREVYVTNQNSANVSVIATATNTVTATVGVGATPYALAVHPDGSKVYVGCMGGGVYVIDTATKGVSVISVGSPVNDMALSDSGDRLYLAMEWSGLKKVTTATNAVSTVSGTVCPEGVTFPRGTNKAYVNYQCAPGGFGTDPVYEYNATTDAYVTGFTVGTQTASNIMASSPDGSKIWVAGSGPTRCVRTSDNATLGTITTPGGTWMTTVSPDSSRAYVSNGGTDLRVYDTATLALVDTLPIATSGWLAFAPSGRRFYAPIPGSGQVQLIEVVPPAPGAPTFSAVTCTTQTVDWEAVAGATTYDVWRSAASCEVGCSASPYDADAGTVLLDHFDTSTSATVAAYVGGVPCGGPAPSATARSFYAASAPGMGSALGLLAPSGQPAGSGTFLTYGASDPLCQADGTLEYWVYLTDYDGAPSVDQGPYIGACMGWTFGMSISPSGQLSAGAWDAFSMDSGSAVVPLNRWVHLACTWGGAGARLYIDGQVVGSDPNTGAPASGYGGYLRVRVADTDGVDLLDELRVSSVQRTVFNTCRSGCTVSPYGGDGTTVLLDPLDGSTAGTIYGDNRQSGCGSQFPSATPRYNYAAGAPGLDRGIALLAPAGTNASSETYIKYPGGALVNRPNGTLEYWVFLSDYAGAPGFDQGQFYGACSGWTFGFGIGSTGQLSAGAWNAFSMNSGSATVPLNRWTHLACSWGSSGATLYIDGVLVGSDTNTGYPANFSGSLMLYCRATGGTALVDEVRLSNEQKSSFNLCAGGPTKLTASPVTGTSYDDSGLTPDTLYSYFITANNAPGTSAAGACATSTTGPPAPSAPAAPTFAEVGCAGLTLNWSPVAGAESYDIWRADGTACTGAAKVNGAPVTDTTFGDSGLTGSTQYSYYLTAANSCGTSPASGCATVTTAPPTPAAPAAPSFSAVTCATQTVTWSAVANATSYDLWRAAGDACAGATKIATVQAQPAAPIPVGSYPVRAVLTPDGQEVYVTNQNSANVSVIATATNTVTATVSVGATPYALAVHPDGSKVYVGCMGGGVYVIDTATKGVSVISVGSPVNDMALSSSGDRLYLAMEWSGLVKVDTLTNGVSTVSGTVCPEGVTFPPGTNKAYVNYQCAPGGFGTDPVFEYNATTDAYVTGFTVGTQTASNIMASSPDGSKIWVAGSGPTRCVRTSDNATLGTITTPGGTWMTTVSPDSSRAYVSNGGTDLRVYDTATLALVDTLPIATSGWLAFAPSGRRFYAPIPGSNQVQVVDLSFSYEDTGLTPGTTYSYYVTATNACGTSDGGTCAASTTSPPVLPDTPAAPAVADPDACIPTGVTVTWGAVPGATSYDLQVDGATAATGVTSPYTYVPGDALPHTYLLRGVNLCGQGAWSPGADATDQSLTPLSVGDLMIDKFGADMLVQWTPLADPATLDYYQVVRAATPQGAFDTVVGTTSLGARTPASPLGSHGILVDMAGEPDVAFYRVRAVKGSCLGPLE